ncbi:hypothetical protein GCM10025882_31520 [Acinetobacter gyllenbergii]|uniref:Abasic site processing protein n=1 Tax=Acinetobacter gyllenbergii CIP 110306 = MTCC 11365 TaxID=1217657 RepID=A0A829HJE8_9GAMM|nr:hypothetical protein F957_02061 [Acinetobacter gyllenbergii CIP 110306 = MTCC 11365]EPH31052.1 hypothetical protein L293_2455 [Acinetobacter gyllenbergii CIP 110306 = MTCC 11365]GMA12727.1 hypothetical protein GCM10025882_31520 [Acinetobacter gyllenbergii]
MCSNYESLAKSRAQLLNLFEPTFDYKSDLFPGFNGPIIIATNGGLEWRSGRFGLIPNWAKEINKIKNTYNARSETIASKPSFKNAWKKINFA